MLILGVDPGYATIGYGVVEYNSSRFRSLEHGAIVTKAHTEFSSRLKIIYDSLIKVIETYHPDCMSIEKLYFNSNRTTAIYVAEARGIILLAGKMSDIKIYEYTPLQVKSAVTGYGRAEKYQVMEMTKRLLCLKEIPKPDDTADALALAITHAQSSSVIKADNIC
jgi:crossover junction endodeoxyribonuclease RuvC